MITFYFDFISPYSYLASQRLEQDSRFRTLEIDPTPVVFGSILSHRGVQGPGEIPTRRAAALSDVLLLAQKYGIPLEGPPAHPFNSLWALRSVAAVQDRKDRMRLTSAYFRAGWGRGENLEDARVLRACLAECGIEQDPEEAATRREIRQATKAATQRAIELGVFGVPTFIYGDLLFFGHDRLELLWEVARGDLVLDRNKWRALLDRPRPGA